MATRHFVEPLDGGRSRYTDVFDIDAGPLTAFVAGFAWVFYRERQHVGGSSPLSSPVPITPATPSLWSGFAGTRRHSTTATSQP